MDVTKLVSDDGEEIVLGTNLVWYITTDAVGQMYVYDADGEPLHTVPIRADWFRPNYEIVVRIAEVLREHMLLNTKLRKEIDTRSAS